MSLFDTVDLTVCPRCKGMGTIYDAKVDADRPCVCQGSIVGASFDLERAKTMGQQGMDAALQADRVVLWRETADGWLLGLEPGSEFCADDLVAAIGLPEADEENQNRNNALGGWFGAKSKQGLIFWTGRFTQSKRPEGHGNWLRVWQRH